MWEEILKGRSASRTTLFIPSLKYGILKYVNDNIPEGELIHLPSLARDPALEQIKTLAKEHYILTRGGQAGGIGGYLHHRAEGQIRNKGGIMLLNAGLVDLGGSASYKKYTRNSTMNDYTLNEISKANDRVNYPIYRQKVYEGISNYIENTPLKRVTIGDIERDKEEIIQYMRNEWSEDEDGKLAGFIMYLKYRFNGQIKPVLAKLVREGKLGELGRISRITTYEIIKAKDMSKVKPKKISPEMEEDIEEVVADNEFENNPTLSDKIKQILMETPEGKPAKTKEDIKEFNRRFPGLKTNIVIEDDNDIEGMDTGCGCGCDGKEVTKASSKCTKRTKKASSTRKGKKWMACVPNGKGGYKRVHWGQRGVSVTGKRGNTKRKKSFRARHKCSTCKGGDYSARCMACRDW